MCSRSLNCPDICTKPYPTPILPPVGVMFNDVAYGTPLIRVTEGGGLPNDSPSVSMFSVNSNFFYVRNNGGAYIFYQVLKHKGKVSGIQQISNPQYFYGFPAWDTSNPYSFYVLGFRQIIKYSFSLLNGKMQWQTPEFEVDFSEIPNTPTPPSDNGYPYGLFYISNNFMMVLVSSTNGQETFNYMLIYNRKDKSKKIINLAQRIGWDTNYYLGTHGMLCDPATQTAYMQLNPFTLGAHTYAVAYDRSSDKFSPSWADNVNGYIGPGGHMVLGPNWCIGGRYAGGGWAYWNPFKQLLVDPVCLFPKKNEQVSWWEDGHPTHIGPRGFIWSSIVGGDAGVFRWSSTENGCWVLFGYHKQWSATLNNPDELRYKAQTVPNAGKIPTAPNGWWYNSDLDNVYFWPLDNDDPNGVTSVFDYFPLQEEVIRFIPDSSGDPKKQWSWERVMHHRCHNDPRKSFYTYPKANVSPNGKLILVATNWDGLLPQTDLLLVDAS